MNTHDSLQFSYTAIIRHPLRAVLVLLAIAIGVASIIIMTGLGEGARRFILNEFSSLGTNLLIIIPGKSETGGAMSIISGATTRDLTLQDTISLQRHHQIKRVAPIVFGAAEASWQQRSREVTIIGSTSELLALRHWSLSQGVFLPEGEMTRASAVSIIGTKIASELFPQTNPVGQKIRIGDRKFRVIGVLASKGRSIDIDTQNLIIIPVASAQHLFNTPGLFRILIETRSRESQKQVKTFIINTIKARHQNEEDITIISQDALLGTFDQILTALTLTITGIAAISLSVAGILIMNIMLITVSQRTAEIGLLKALGASRHQIQILFITDALLLATTGAILGILLGQGSNLIIHHFLPTLNNSAPLWSIVTAFLVAVFTGLLFGVIPARRAADLNPIQSLAHH
ncbi:MAG: FtsX-like permease family protein [Gammaproteobacteria bacterium]|nr:FtsX-like permease family protein [Gammaproteobacteria bacterium]